MTDNYKDVLSEKDLKNLELILLSVAEKYVMKKSSKKLRDILVLVSRATKVSIADIVSKSREREKVEARHIYMTLAKHIYPSISNREIANIIDMDHASVNAAKKTTSEIPTLKLKYETIKNRMDGN
jgi:chromosomal replication initiation ATPase DnaA